jgi:hypothetical protein
MLTLIDQGCSEHQSRHLILSNSQAEMMEDILYNLPRAGDCRTYICEHGQTHQLCLCCNQRSPGEA